MGKYKMLHCYGADDHVGAAEIIAQVYLAACRLARTASLLVSSPQQQ